MAEIFVFPWEAQAQKSEPMPDGLELPDQMAYLSIRAIYQAYRSGYITQEIASKEKASVRRTWAQAIDQLKFRRKLSAHQVAVNMATEKAKADFLLHPSIEAGRQLIRRMDGVDT